MEEGVFRYAEWMAITLESRRSNPGEYPVIFWLLFHKNKYSPLIL